jgi:hypothetical protein
LLHDARLDAFLKYEAPVATGSFARLGYRNTRKQI